ncbi:MAG: hypothetical protein LBU90_10545 [Bacteroidales bacterium]|jgi:ribosomal protein L37AE/L43A|nr:hypothetical protein [Bacteroidales bacterium]
MDYQEKIRKEQALLATEDEKEAYKRGFLQGVVFIPVISEVQKVGYCPQCGNSWRGKSYFDQYKAHIASLPDVTATDEEIQELVKKRHGCSHASLLFHLPHADRYVCPFCAQTFDVEE